MASPRPRHRRGSMELPTNMLSDVIHLTDELNRLNEDVSLECNKHKEKLNDVINEFKNGIRFTSYAIRGGVIAGGIAMVLSALSFYNFITEKEISLFFSGVGASLALVGISCAVFGRNRKTQQKKNLKQSVENNLKGFQDKMNPIIEMMEKICQRTEEILRDPSLSAHKTKALSEHFAHCFEKRHLFQEQDKGKVAKIGHLSGNISEMIAKISSVPDILKEIIEDNERKRAKPAKPRQEQINKREFKEKVEKFLNGMQKAICDLRNGVKAISQTTDSLSDILS